MFYNYFLNYIRPKCKCESCENKVTYLNRRIESLTRSLSESISPVVINAKQKNIAKPYNIANIKDCEVGDLEYYSFTLAEWKTILTDIYNELKPKETYTTRIFDCDDFALVFSGILAYSAFKSGFVLQPAFAIAWSNTHAFNLFVTSDNKVYLYEPQSGKIMTWNEANKIDSYKVRKIWFMS